MAVGISSSVSASLIPQNFQKSSTSAAPSQSGGLNQAPNHAGVLASKPPKGYRFEPCLLQDETLLPVVRGAFANTQPGITERVKGVRVLRGEFPPFTTLGYLDFTNRKGQADTAYVHVATEAFNGVPKGSFLIQTIYGDDYFVQGSTKQSPVQTNYGAPFYLNGDKPPKNGNSLVTIGQVGAAVLDNKFRADWTRPITYRPVRNEQQKAACEKR